MRLFCVMALMALVAHGACAAVNLSISSDPYLTGGLFTNPLLPQEGEAVTITVRARCEGPAPASIPALLTIHDRDGVEVRRQLLTLPRDGAQAQAAFVWEAARNGLYTVRAQLDPEYRITESNEDDNTAELTLPVIVAGKYRVPHFPWYGEVPTLRWTTCVTSINKEPETPGRLEERGVKPLHWEYGGMSWSYYDKERAAVEPDAVAAEFEEIFYKKFTTPNERVRGFGIDEVGGYPGSFKFKASIASLKGLVRAKAEMPERFYAVWNGGGPRPEIAELARQGADLFLLEIYLWRALPDELGAEDIYEAIVSRVEPYVRGTDMFQPAYGNHCYTLIALDTSERPDRTDLGEQEQVVRFIRRRFPEMRGIGWYNGGYGNAGYGMERTEETDRHHAAVMANADRLCFEYWIKPCVTLMRESLWLTTGDDGATLTAAVSNIGGVDSRAVTVEFLVNGESVGAQTVEAVPAGANRNENRALIRQPINVAPGAHVFEARIVAAPDSTVLDSSVGLRRLIP